MAAMDGPNPNLALQLLEQIRNQFPNSRRADRLTVRLSERPCRVRFHWQNGRVEPEAGAAAAETNPESVPNSSRADRLTMDVFCICKFQYTSSVRGTQPEADAAAARDGISSQTSAAPTASW